MTALLTFNRTGTGAFANAFGDDFVVGNSAIVVSKLGAYLDPGKPWVSSKTIWVYRTDTQAVLATLTITVADVTNGLTTAIGSGLYKSLATPVTIPANTPISLVCNGYATDNLVAADSDTTSCTINGTGITASNKGRTGTDTTSFPPNVLAGTAAPVPFLGPTLAYDLASGGGTSAITPTSFPMGVSTPFTLVGTGTSWTSATRPMISGGAGTGYGNITVNGQTITGYFNPGTTAGSLTVGNTTDSSTVTVTAVLAITKNVVVHGDSLSFGFGASNPGTALATRLNVIKTGLGAACQITNNGNSGHTLSQMITEVATLVTPLFDSTKALNILVVQGGHNDFVAGASTSDVISRIQAYLNAVLAAKPWKIVWSTQPPGDSSLIPLLDSFRDTVNAWLRLNWANIGISMLSDFGADHRTCQNGAEQNSFYYYDKVHFTDAGYTIWGNYDLAACQFLDNTTLPVGGGGGFSQHDIDEAVKKALIEDQMRRSQTSNYRPTFPAIGR